MATPAAESVRPAGLSNPHLGLLLVIVVAFGFTFIAAKFGIMEFPPVFFTGFRFLILWLMFLPFMRWHPGQMGRIAIIGLCAGGLHFALMYAALFIAGDLAPVAIGVQLGPPFATLLSVIFLGEVIRWRRTLGLMLAFAGVAVLAFDPRVVSYIEALLLTVSAAFSYAVATIFMRQVDGVGVWDMQGWVGLVSWPILLAISFAMETGQIDAVFSAGWRGWGGMLFVIFGASIVGHAGIYFLLQRYEIGQVMPLTLAAPVVGIIAGIVILDDVLTWRMALGGAVTLVGVAIILRRQPPPRAVEP